MFDWIHSPQILTRSISLKLASSLRRSNSSGVLKLECPAMRLAMLMSPPFSRVDDADGAEGVIAYRSFNARIARAAHHVPGIRRHDLARYQPVR